MRIAAAACLVLSLLACSAGAAEPTYKAHGIAMHGDLKYGPDFTHFDYVNPDAPKGGELREYGLGTFDSFNPFVIRGIPDRNSARIYDTLMVSSADEPFSEYGLLAESIETPADRSWVIFTLRPQARWHDGQPITADDVIWTFDTLRTKGSPEYRAYYASVAGVEIPPVVRFVTGFQNGGRSVRPGLITLNQYIPDFNDPPTGKVVAQGFIHQGADIIFGVGGNTGNGGLLAAKEAGLMAIGVDVDQYFTYPEVRAALLTSASKKMDVAAAVAVSDFAAGKLAGGIRYATLANGGVGLAPYHNWDGTIPPECKAKVSAAEAAIKANPAITGAQ